MVSQPASYFYYISAGFEIGAVIFGIAWGFQGGGNWDLTPSSQKYVYTLVLKDSEKVEKVC